MRHLACFARYFRYCHLHKKSDGAIDAPLVPKGPGVAEWPAVQPAVPGQWDPDPAERGGLGRVSVLAADPVGG